jgi:hypothetical protein
MWPFRRSVRDNPIRQLLDDAGVPWRWARSALAERYGIREHPAYQWDVIEIPMSAPIVQGMLWSLSVQVRPQFSPAMPATHFSAITRIGDDARENLHNSLEQLTPRLGKSETADNANTLGVRWVFGASSLGLRVWPPELQRWQAPNPSLEREPRLKSACHLSIETRWRGALSAAELRHLVSFVPIDRIQIDDRRIAVHTADTLPAEQSELEFVRTPPAKLAQLFGFIGHSADGATLIFWHRQLYLVPMADVIGFHVDRRVRAKGPGGAKLYVECRTNYAELATKRLLIAAAPGADDLNELAKTLSAATTKPFTLGRYWPDD